MDGQGKLPTRDLRASRSSCARVNLVNLCRATVFTSLLTRFALHFQHGRGLAIDLLQIPLRGSPIGLTLCAYLQGSISAAEASPHSNPAKMLLSHVVSMTICWIRNGTFDLGLSVQ